MDSLIGRYRMIMKTKKIVHKNILSLIRYDGREFMAYVEKNYRQNTMPLAKFRENLSVTFMQSGITKRGEGRRSNSFEVQENI